MVHTFLSALFFCFYTKMMEVMIISILFSLVTASVGNSKQNFLLPGIPKNSKDLAHCQSLQSFFPNMEKGAMMLIHGDAYLHGRGEWCPATVEELAYIMQRIQRDKTFLCV